MKYYILSLVISLFMLSCTSSDSKHINKDENAVDTVEEDKHVSVVEEDYYPIDSIELYILSPKRAIIKDVFDKAINLFNKREVYLYLNDYDYFYITLLKCNNSDTICYVGYENLRLLELNNDSHYHLLGYMNWGHYPVLVYGDVVFSFYNHGDKTKVFHRGDLVDWTFICYDENDIRPNEVAFVISGNRFREANNLD